jgi:LPS sulfotransferase NodH
MPDALQTHRRPSLPFDPEGRIRIAYFVCTTHRSGSTFFCEGLADAGCGSPNEFFEESLAAIWREKWELPSDADALTFLGEMIRRHATADGFFGAKLMWHQTKHLAKLLQPIVAPEQPEIPFAEILARAFGDVRYFWLRREDKVAQAISLVRARQTGRWHSVDTTGWIADAPSGQGETFDFAQIDSILKQQSKCDAKWKKFFADSGVRVMTLVYEEFSKNFSEAMREALTFVGAPSDAHNQIPPPRHRKLADKTSEEWAQRYLAMRKETGTEF